ncbi:hypothetical protein [Megalodesulfovibrio paquesii]
MGTGHFHIIFDGPAFENHEMNVRDLAPALLAVSDIFEEINRVAFEGRYRVGVNVRASFKTGSFLTELALRAASVLEFFKDDDAQAVILMLQTFGITSAPGLVKSLLAFIRWVRRRKITKIVELDADKVRVEIQDEAIDVERVVVDLYRSSKLRKGFEDLVAKPLQKDGVDSVGFGNDSATQFVAISREEAEWFIADEPEDEPMGVSTRRAHLQILSPSFQEGNKWRFSDGSVSFHAEIRDKAFLERVMSGEAAFARGDILDVEMTEAQTLTAKGLSTERYVERVWGHRNPYRQYRLPLEE